MSMRRIPFLVMLLVLATSQIVRGDGPATAPADPYHARIVPLLETYCYECHGDGMSSGNLELDSFKTIEDVRRNAKTWQKVIQYVRTHTMPPPKADQPPQEVRESLAETIHSELYQIDPTRPDPGRVTVRRLNRAEYRNSIRDLIGVSFDPTIDFPQDDTGYGFDNIADVLTLPPMLMEKYVAATEKIMEQAIPAQRAESLQRQIAATEATPSFAREDGAGRVRGERWVKLSSADEDSLSVRVKSAAPADYLVRVLAYAHYDEAPPPGKTNHPPVKLSLMLGDAVVREIDVEAEENDPRWYEARVGAPAGGHQMRITLRRERGPTLDRDYDGKRLGREQPGSVFVKEILIDGPVTGAVRRIRPDRMEAVGDASVGEGGMSLHRTDDQAGATIYVGADGKYLLRAQAYADYAGNEPARMELLLDGKPLKTFDVSAPAGWKASPTVKELPPGAGRPQPHVYEVQAELTRGERKLSARYVNNFKEAEHPDPNYRDRNIHIQHFEVVELSAPPMSPPMTEPLRKLFARHGGKDAGPAQARALLADFTRRAWRRPAQPDELDRVMKLYDVAAAQGEDFPGAVRHAMKGVLLTSSFLFRGEPQQSAGATAGGNEAVGEYELASRLSYFLWSSTPDDELLDLAERRELRKNLEAQLKRMLASRKAEAFIDNFAGQWLQFRNLDAVHPDRKLFKTYNDRLRDSMIRETQLFFTHVLREDRSLLDVLTGNYTFVNERLAKHYGLKDQVKGEEFKRVSLDGTPRTGVLTHGSVLTLTSNPTRTSPVKRGKWVMENLLGTPPPPPPANVPPLEAEGRQLTGTLRQRLEQHRESKSCASCHAALDPIGFGLENFDAVGAWREKDGSTPVDASSALAGGAKFDGPRELADLLARTRRKDFYRSTTEAALTFALGRGVEPYDQPAVDRIVQDLQKNDGRFSTLIHGVVNSVPFQMRRAENSSGAAQARADGISQ